MEDDGDVELVLYTKLGGVTGQAKWGSVLVQFSGPFLLKGKVSKWCSTPSGAPLVAPMPSQERLVKVNLV